MDFSNLVSFFVPLTSNPYPIFSTTVLCGKSPKCWKTMLILFLLNSNKSFELILVTSTSSIFTVPDVGSINLEMHLTNVDFPLPDRPITTNVSPF